MQEEIEMLMRVMGKIELAVCAERIQQSSDPSYIGDTDIESDVSEQIPFPLPSGPRSKLNGPSQQKKHRSEKDHQKIRRTAQTPP